LALFAAIAAAQPPSFTTDSTITLSMAWSDNGGGNGNHDGVLQPGEKALITMDISFTNQGGIAHFDPPVGGVDHGIIAGFGGGFFSVRGTGGTA
jgi:hypothetical protein